MFEVGDKVKFTEDHKEYVKDFGGDPDTTYTVRGIERSFGEVLVYMEGLNFGAFEYRLEKVTEEKEVKKMTKVPFTCSEDSATVVVKGDIYTLTSAEPTFKDLVEHLKLPEHDEDVLLTLVNTKAAVEAYTKGNVSIEGGVVFYKGEEVNDSLTDKMLSMMEKGFDIGPWVAFFENLMQNPSFRSRKCLFNFLEKFQAPFTEDGCFVAFKRVREDFMDLRKGEFDNSVGKIVEMPRSEVDDDPSHTCSAGLHVAASSYLDSYASASRAKTIMLKVNPADVVAVPHDYNFAKMRVCKYEVIADITVEQMSELEKMTVVTPANYSAPFGEYEVGDYIEVTRLLPGSGDYFESGETYLIVSIDNDDETFLIENDHGDSMWVDIDGREI